MLASEVAKFLGKPLEGKDHIINKPCNFTRIFKGGLVWVGKYETITLIMIRTASTRQAEIAVETEWKSFTTYDPEIEMISIYDEYEGPPDKNWCVAGSWGNPAVYATSHGPVLIMFINNSHSGWSDDPSSNYPAFQELAELQISKLEYVGYLP